MTTTAATDLTQLAADYADLTDRINTLEQARDAIKAQLRALGVGNHPAGALTVQVTPNRRVDPALVEQRYPIAAHPLLYRAVPDTNALKRHLSPVAYEELYVEVGEPKVSIR